MSTLIFQIKLFAITYTTIVNGNWNNTGCWAGGNIAPLQCADTIIIKHHLVLPSDLNLLSGAYLLIEANGGVCGHVQLFVNDNAGLLKYGILEIDVLNMSGGTVDLLPPGNTIFTEYGLLTGGSFNNTSNFSVGPWFECQMPEYQFVNAISNSFLEMNLQQYPNPATNFITIKTSDDSPNFKLVIFDDKGSIVYQNERKTKECMIDISDLKSGLYFIEVISNQSISYNKFCKR